jgi:hypothetical protein
LATSEKVAVPLSAAKAALGADRHDHCVLDLLRFHQAEDLGAEILRPVRPAQATARNLAKAQVNTFDAR